MQIVKPGRTFLLGWKSSDKWHLWVVLTEPTGNPESFVAVMIRTATRFTDDTVILQEEDHPFIKHPSSVHYSTADYFKVRQLQKAMEGNHCHIKEDLAKDVLAKIREGLLKSPFTVYAIREHCRQAFKR